MLKLQELLKNILVKRLVATVRLFNYSLASKLETSIDDEDLKTPKNIELKVPDNFISPMIDFKDTGNMNDVSMNKPSVSSVKSEEKLPDIIHLKQKPFRQKKKTGHKLINNVFMSGDYKKALRGKYLKKHASKDRYSKFYSKRQGIAAIFTSLDRKSTTADTKDIQNKASFHRSPDMNRILQLSKPRHVSCKILQKICV